MAERLLVMEYKQKRKRIATISRTAQFGKVLVVRTNRAEVDARQA